MNAQAPTPNETELQLVPETPKPPQPSAPALKFRDAYTTRCAACPRMLALPLPYVHCPKCCHVWKARRMSAPVRCVACRCNLADWRKLNGVQERSNAGALLA